MSRHVPAILLLTLALVLAACGGPTAAPTSPPELQPDSELNFYNWSEYIDPEIYGLFAAETGIAVVEDNFASNEEMLAKLQGGVTGYELIVPSDYTVAIMIEEGMLAELDHNNIPNLANLKQEFRNVPFDPGNKYCVPYQWGTTGIGYNAAEVAEPASWAVLFDPAQQGDLAGRFTLLDDSRESLGAALIYLGYSANSTNEAQLEQARDLLISAKAGVQGFDSEQYNDLLAAGETLATHGWNGDILVAQEENENIAYTIPQEGGVIWIDNLCIPATASPQGKLAAERFIDFLLTPEVGAMLSQYNYYASPNAAAEDFLDEEFLEDAAVYPPPAIRERLQFLEPLGEFEAVYQRMWDEVKAAP